MSATLAPQGFVPVYHPSGLSMPVSVYTPTTANGPSAAIYRGDPVKLTGTTDVINISTGSDAIIGVFAGCEYNDASGKPTESSYWPGTTTGATNIKFYVNDDPFTVFEVQAAGSIAITAVGDSADATIVAGNTNTGTTATRLSTTLSGAATVKQWRILGLGQEIDNAWGDAYTIVRVKIGQSQVISTPNAI
jgi:hypothetical protein